MLPAARALLGKRGLDALEKLREASLLTNRIQIGVRLDAVEIVVASLERLLQRVQRLRLAPLAGAGAACVVEDDPLDLPH